jgi:CRISPR type I-E-associated protein CasB/Cse2
MTATITDRKSFLNARFIKDLEEKAGFKFTKNEADNTEILEFNESRINRAALSDLRKDLGKPANKAIFAMKYIAKWTADFSDNWDVESYYIIATLFALYQQKVGKNEEAKKSWHHDKSLKSYQRNFGASFNKLELQMREVRESSDNKTEKLKTLEQRFITVIRSKRAELPVRLRHAILLLASYEIQIDWIELLKDLMLLKIYESPLAFTGTSPQRSWSQSFWRINEDILEENENSEEKK